MESTTREIDGTSYTITPLPAWEGYATSAALVKMFGPVLMGGAMAVSGEGAASGLPSALSLTLQGAQVPEFLQLSKKLLSTVKLVQPDGSTPRLEAVADVHFQGRVMTMYRVIAFALEVNFADFFGVLKNAGAKFAGKFGSLLGSSTPSPSASPPAGTAGA